MREARAALKPLFKVPAAAKTGAGASDPAPPKFAVHMSEIDDGALTARGSGARGFGGFRLSAVGMNESTRKYVAAARRATRLYLALNFAAGAYFGATLCLLLLNIFAPTLSSCSKAYSNFPMYSRAASYALVPSSSNSCMYSSCVC